ncbi:MAG TPA: hypothetical protein ENN54_01695 [Thermoplasmatales archaeon]|nr:hypothetical protein [Thermoplasmatales archaeon]
MHPRIAMVAVAAAAAVVIAGSGYTYYADVSAIRDSQVQLENVRLTSLRLTQATLALQVTVDNPSGRDISDLTVSFDILLADAFVGNGSFPALSVPAHGQRTRDLNATVYFAQLSSAVISALQQGRFVVVLRGTVEGRVLLGLTTFSQSFSTSYVFS